jgi:predicted ABC-type ATPase
VAAFCREPQPAKAIMAELGLNHWKTFQAIDAFVNADVIAQGLAAFSPGSAAFEVGRIMLRRIEELARAREDFAFESTLAGRSAHRLLTGLVGVGYDVHIFYLWLPSPDLAVARVRRCVEAGGHDVPEPVIRRRFSKSLVNKRIEEVA